MARTPKQFDPPTKQEMIDYAKLKNLNINAADVWNMWDAGDWIKANGEPIRSWKQTMWTHHMCNEEKGKAPACQVCKKRPAPYIKGQDSDGNPYHYCHNHKPPEPPSPPQVQEMARGIGVIPLEPKPEPIYKQRKRLFEKDN
jgi:hypothetical protein